MKPEDFGITNSHKWYECKLDFYKLPDDIEKWSTCPFCGLKPKIWVFDNGRYTACGCHVGDDYPGRYNHFHIRAESIFSYHNRNKTLRGYKTSHLRRNWNMWCNTGVIKFDDKSYINRW